MHIEKELIISILKLTKNGPILNELVNKNSKISYDFTQNLLRQLQEKGLIYLHENMIEANATQRLKLAVYAMQLGADFERVCHFLQWKEFENVAVVAFERNSYSVVKNLWFKHAGQRWEVDVVGCKKPVVLCVDCKHWHHGLPQSSLKKIVEKQVERTFALSEALPALADKIECTSWNVVKLVPAVLSLVTGEFKFYNDVPIVSVLQLQDFLSQLPAYVDSIKHFSKRLAN